MKFITRMLGLSSEREPELAALRRQVRDLQHIVLLLNSYVRAPMTGPPVQRPSAVQRAIERAEADLRAERP